jgi:hypothetical protein
VTTALLAFLLSHESSVSSSRLEFGREEVRVTFTFSLEDLAELARLDPDRDGTVSPEEWRRVLPAILAYVGAKFRIESGGEALASEGDPGVVPGPVGAAEGRAPVVLALRYRSPRALDRVDLRCELFNEHGGNPRHVATFAGGRTLVFDRDRPRVDGVSATPASSSGVPLPALVAVAASLLLGAAALRIRPVTGRSRAAQERPPCSASSSPSCSP